MYKTVKTKPKEKRTAGHKNYPPDAKANDRT